MAITRQEFIRSIAANIFWTDMARPASERTPLDRESANSLICGILLNRGIPWEKAMSAMDTLKSRTGYTDTLLMCSEMSVPMLEYVMFDDGNGAIHRYRYMADYLHQLMCGIRDEWDGDARNLWSDEPTFSTLQARLMDFKGYGLKCSSLAIRLAVLSHGVILWDKYTGMDVSADRHMCRVMQRLGLVGENPTQQEVINKAREISPMCAVELEGLFGLALSHCHASRQECHGNTNEDGYEEREPCPLLPACLSAR